MGEGDRLRIEQAEFEVISDIGNPGHQLHAGGSAERLDVAIFKAHAGGGEAVEVRGLVGLAAVGRHAFVAEIVGHDEDDIGRARRGGGGVRGRKQEREREGEKERRREGEEGKVAGSG